MLGGRAGSQIPDDDFGPLVEQAGRLADGVALDAAVRRIGCVAIDAGQLEGTRVHPRCVHVGVDEVDGTVGLDGIELRFLRSGGEHLELPATAENPGIIGMLGDVAADGLDHRLG